MNRFASALRRLITDESAATLAEYGILLLIVATMSIVTIRSIGMKVSTGFQTVNSTLPNGSVGLADVRLRQRPRRR